MELVGDALARGVHNFRPREAPPHHFDRLRVFVDEDVPAPQFLSGGPRGPGTREEVEHPVPLT